ncbi:MAG TPA: ribosome maturation factor RimP [Actinomycetota bacterium]|nr:ribosome maturation factor RimP [Actinomycetota bacterium]
MKATAEQNGWVVRAMGALDEVRDLAEAVTRRRSLSVWDVEVAGQPGRSIVRIFVTSDNGGLDLDTVAQVADEISRGLDLKDPIPGAYTLEVSSPGLERTLRSPEHFARSVGDKVTIKTRERLVANSHRIDGVIVEADDSKVRVNLGAEEVDVPLDGIKSARTVFDW